MVNATISAGRRLLYENGYKNMIIEIKELWPYKFSCVLLVFISIPAPQHFNRMARVDEGDLQAAAEAAAAGPNSASSVSP